MKKPLEGIKVLDLSTYIAGPGTGTVLSDWGADVIKIEGAAPEEGRKTGLGVGCPASDECNPYFASVNLGKRAISINLKNEKGKEVMDKLMKSADVFVTNIRSKALVRLGLDWETVHKKYPKIVFAHVTGFGEDGPQKDDPGYDTVAFWAKSGYQIDMSDETAYAPLNPIWGFADGLSNPIMAGGIAAALYGREKTGEGSKVMYSLYGCGVWGANTVVASTQYGDKFPRTRTKPSSPMANTYRCKDNEWLMISNFDDKLYPVFLEKIVGRSDLAADERYNCQAGYPEHSEEVTKLADEAFAKVDSADMLKLLAELGIAHTKIGHFAEIPKDPQAIENRYVIPIKHRDGTTSMTARPPVQFDDHDNEPSMTYPLFAEHTEEILKEIGITDPAEIKKLVDDGAVCVRN